MKIALFGQLKEMAPEGILDIPAVKNTRELRLLLEERFSLLKSLPYLLAVDKQIAGEDLTLRPDQEIAILPPYSGG